MRNVSLTLIIFIVSIVCGCGQSSKEIDKILSEQLSQNSANGGRWIYNKEYANIQPINKPTIDQLLPQLSLYRADLINTSVEDVAGAECLVVLNKITSKITIVPPLWYSHDCDFLLKALIGKQVKDDDELKALVTELQSLLIIGSDGEIRNTVYKPQNVAFDFYILMNGKYDLSRNYSITLSKNVIKSFKSIP